MSVRDQSPDRGDRFYHCTTTTSVPCVRWSHGCFLSSSIQLFIHSVCFPAVGEEEVSSIGRGLCVLLGVSVEDTQKDADYM